MSRNGLQHKNNDTGKYWKYQYISIKFWILNISINISRTSVKSPSISIWRIKQYFPVFTYWSIMLWYSVWINNPFPFPLESENLKKGCNLDSKFNILFLMVYWISRKWRYDILKKIGKSDIGKFEIWFSKDWYNSWNKNGHILISTAITI